MFNKLIMKSVKFTHAVFSTIYMDMYSLAIASYICKLIHILLLLTAVPVTMDTSTPIDTTSGPYYADLFKSKSVGDAYTTFTSELCILLRKADLSALKLALTSQAKAPSGIELKKPLNEAVRSAKTSDELLITLEEFPDSNWLDTRLLKALVNGSRLSGAENLIKAYREFLSSKKLSEVLSEFPKSKIKESYITKICVKIDVSKDITIGDLFRYCNILEDVILNLGKRVLRIKDIKKGCLEISLSSTQHSFIAYKVLYKIFKISSEYVCCPSKSVDTLLSTILDCLI